MIANVSPLSNMYDDTHNTLKYADRAKQIKASVSHFSLAVVLPVLLKRKLVPTNGGVVINVSISLCPCLVVCAQLKSNVLSLNSHVGQYAHICEKQQEEV